VSGPDAFCASRWWESGSGQLRPAASVPTPRSSKGGRWLAGDVLWVAQGRLARYRSRVTNLEGLGPGDVLADKFRLDSLLGQGGMGSVWRAHHLTLNSPVALKLIEPSLATHPDARSRFMREAQAAAALRSPHVVQTFDFGLHDDIPYIAMEMLEGETLADRLDRQKILLPGFTAHVMTHVARAVSKAHDAGIVHRDLKPDNVFLVANEDEEIAKILDFGIAKATGASLLESDSKTRTGALLGTPYYMSPEQAQGDKTVDWRSDLWSMAIITYECLLGHRPFDSDGLGNLLVKICVEPVPVPSEKGAVPPGFDAWFARATQRDPEQRFQSAREQAQALRAALLGANERASQISSPAFDAAGNPLDPDVVQNVATTGPAEGASDRSPGTGSGQQRAASHSGETIGSHLGPVPVAPGEWGAERAHLTTGGVAAAELDADPVRIPTRSSAGLVVGLLAGLLLIGGGAVATLNWVGAKAESVPAASSAEGSTDPSAVSAQPDDAVAETVIAPAASASASPESSAAPTRPSARVAATPPSPTRSPAPSPKTTVPPRPVVQRPMTAPPAVASPPPAPPATRRPPPVPPAQRDRLGF